jgi:hypothetical protein
MSPTFSPSIRSRIPFETRAEKSSPNVHLASRFGDRPFRADHLLAGHVQKEAMKVMELKGGSLILRQHADCASNLVEQFFPEDSGFAAIGRIT